MASYYKTNMEILTALQETEAHLRIASETLLRTNHSHKANGLITLSAVDSHRDSLANIIRTVEHAITVCKSRLYDEQHYGKTV